MEKLSDLLRQSFQLPESKELNSREQENIYAGAILGLLTPIVATRYLVFGLGSEENLYEEAVKWGASLVAAPISIPCGLIGSLLGFSSAQSLRAIRQEKEKRERNLGKIIGV